MEERDHEGEEMQRRCYIFNYFIEHNDINKLGFHGPQFTWTKGKILATLKIARVGRALYNIQ